MTSKKIRILGGSILLFIAALLVFEAMSALFSLYERIMLFDNSPLMGTVQLTIILLASIFFASLFGVLGFDIIKGKC